MLNVTNTHTAKISRTEIERGRLQGSTLEVDYVIVHGNDLVLASEADYKWQYFYHEIFLNISTRGEEEINQILQSLTLQDKHWSWLRKAAKLNSEEYEWFYLIAENEVQGICLIYHPKRSELEKGNIFYVEYIAVAPWNRTSMVNTKKFDRVGSKLLKVASHYACNSLDLKPGFSLHSLPQSESYYSQIGMIEIPEKAKDNLKFFEMNKDVNEKWRSSNDRQ